MIKLFQVLVFETNNLIQDNSERVQVLLFNIGYSIQYYLFVGTKLNGSKNCWLILIIQFRHTVKECEVLLFNTNYSILLNSFIR